MDNGEQSSHSEEDFVAIYFPLTRPLICTHEAVIPLTFKVRSQNTGRIPPDFPRQYVSFQFGNEIWWVFLIILFQCEGGHFIQGVPCF